MGYALVGYVGALGMAGRLVELPSSSIACLYVMAWASLDHEGKRGPARVYFRGHEHLARAALGRIEYDEAARRAVTRAVGELKRQGLIKDIGRRNGLRQGTVMYELLFGL